MNTLTTTNLTSTTTLTSGEAAFLGGFTGSLLIASLIFAVLVIVAEWKIFEKAGEKGWKSLIPIYGQYILFKIVGAKAWFWGLLCISIITSIMMGVNSPVDFTLPQEQINAQLEVVEWSNYVPFVIGMVVTCIASFVVEIVLAIKIAKAFGKGAAYIIGLIFVAPIVLMVLGFGKAKYDKKVVKD
ncbi:hypothetical protein IKF23_01850 [Candidatus Saccharibacteria bacterium]|nr:hypothetical protein [Candidatus Saccharibacteria bacterium]